MDTTSVVQMTNRFDDVANRFTSDEPFIYDNLEHQNKLLSVMESKEKIENRPKMNPP